MKKILILLLLLFVFGSASASVHQYAPPPDQLMLDSYVELEVLESSVPSLTSSILNGSDNLDLNYTLDSQPTTIANIPEPATILLFTIGLVGIAVRKKFLRS